MHKKTLASLLNEPILHVSRDAQHDGNAWGQVTSFVDAVDKYIEDRIKRALTG